jgi:hypothetical protein
MNANREKKKLGEMIEIENSEIGGLSTTQTKRKKCWRERGRYRDERVWVQRDTHLKRVAQENKRQKLVKEWRDEAALIESLFAPRRQNESDDDIVVASSSSSSPSSSSSAAANEGMASKSMVGVPPLHRIVGLSWDNVDDLLTVYAYTNGSILSLYVFCCCCLLRFLMTRQLGSLLICFLFFVF